MDELKDLLILTDENGKANNQALADILLTSKEHHDEVMDSNKDLLLASGLTMNEMKEVKQLLENNNVEAKLDDLVQAIKDIPTVEIPEAKEIDLSETNRLLQELAEKDIDLSPITEVVNKIVDKVNEPINVTVTLDIV